jgi:hypothetical protein
MQENNCLKLKFVPGKAFQPGLIFVGKDPRKEHLKGASHEQLPTNIRIDWKASFRISTPG